VNKSSYWVVIPAAGVGRRMGADRPKQYLSLHGRSVLERTIDLFTSHPEIRGIAVAIGKNDSWWPTLECSRDPRVMQVEGGIERADSVRNALEFLAHRASDEDWVLVHDAARPLLSDSDLARLMTQASNHPVGGILAVPARDTIKRVGEGNRIESTVDRSTLWHAQTPQMFRLNMLRRALIEAADNGLAVTDEASAMELMGLSPIVIEGSADNIKITRPEDLGYAEWLLQKA